MNDMKYILKYDEAVTLLPDRDSIHTFYNEAWGLIGADWSRKEILDKLSQPESVIELTGKQACAVKHGIAVYNKNAKYQREILFVETDEEKLLAFKKAHQDEENKNDKTE